jgi:hypothetical protein
MEFTATESGFDNGIAGASNGMETEDHHYVLFGRQTDGQHPECNGIYFEFDDQIHGSVNCVTRIKITAEGVEFKLKDGMTIVVRRGMGEQQWSEFLRRIHEVFRDDIVQKV